jgi:hypothetical protein
MRGDYIIVDANGWFWTGRNWNPEYPEAVIFGSLRTARQAAEKLTRAYIIVSGYGLASEYHFAVKAGG